MSDAVLMTHVSIYLIKFIVRNVTAVVLADNIRESVFSRGCRFRNY